MWVGVVYNNTVYVFSILESYTLSIAEINFH